MATIPQPPSFSSGPQPAWDVALLFPYQGDWSECDYLALDTNQLVELVGGNLEVLPMPTPAHQVIVAFLYGLLSRFVAAGSLGTVFFAPLPVRIHSSTFREPDIVFVARNNSPFIDKKNLRGADLVMEIVSPGPDAQQRDYDDKRADSAQAGIKEYWIVDPQVERITVLSLDGNQYRVLGEFSPGQQAASVLLDGFTVDVATAFASAKAFG